MQRLIALLVCVLLGTPTFIMALALAGTEPEVSYNGNVVQSATLDIGAALDNEPFLTYTMTQGNKQGGFTLEFKSDYVFNHNGDPTTAGVNGVLETTYGVSVDHNKDGDGHNQPFQLNANNLVDGNANIILKSSSTAAIGTAQIENSTDSPVISYTDPERAVTSDDTITIGLTTAVNSLLISGTYVAEITVTIADI